VVRAATAAEVPRVAAALADAFQADPVWSWLLPDARRRPAALRRYFAIELRTIGRLRLRPSATCASAPARR